MLVSDRAETDGFYGEGNRKLICMVGEKLEAILLIMKQIISTVSLNLVGG